MKVLRPINELVNLGFIVFDGLDFTGKSYLAKRAVGALKKDDRFRLNVKYNHNHGFLNKGIVDSTYLKKLNLPQRVDYLLKCYERDVLSNDPKEFSEVFQDRYLPYLIHYAITKCNGNLESLVERCKKLTKPKHLFLIECGYGERLRRANVRSNIKENEIISLLSKENHNKHINIYQEICQALNVPYTVIDTTNLYEKEVVNYFLDLVADTKLMVYNVPTESLFADTETSVFETTAKFKLEELLNGRKNHPPISIMRRIDNKGNYVNLIKGGRHRTFAAWNTRKKDIYSYISYEFCHEIDQSKLKHISEFTYRKGDLNLMYKIK